jgi:hypothetical protein
MSEMGNALSRVTSAGMLALLLASAGCERRHKDGDEVSRQGPESEVPALKGSVDGRSPSIGYMIIAPEISEETPVVNQRLSPTPGRPTFLRNDTLYVAADDLLRVLSPGARVSLGDGAVVVNDRKLPVTGLERNGAVYVPVKAFARQFGALTLLNEVDGSATIWPKDVLIYWKKHGPGNAPVLLQAAAEGLIPP